MTTPDPEWSELYPYVQAKLLLEDTATYIANTGDVRDALDRLDQFQMGAYGAIQSLLCDWPPEFGDPCAFFKSHCHAMQLVRWARARMWFRAVLKWEPPAEVPSYETPAVLDATYRFAIWN